jgi:catechol 2,3-dioxygenase-like lactoylglutathione lyase family enzyme
MEEVMNFLRFEHINQACRNLDVTCQFYQTLFPDWFVRAEGNSGGTRWIHFGDRQFYLSLYEISDPAGFASSNTGHLDHVGFVIEDGAKILATLDANGIEYHIEASPETKYRIYVSDPEGTWIELVEYQDLYNFK